ncbi:hypothetical protein VH571_13825 [Frondihabitans sp. 4ASC-45]|jgi:hypothetical protein|uniref:hypothetical protein n=1 Tax=Frondihabitans sp. 4ASC-45 TaxID=3111636 RepID=UPI003C2296FB
MLKLLRARIGGRLLRVIGARDDERGMALATVIILGTVLMLMSGAIVSVSVSGAQKSVYDANWNAAGAAAYAGVEDYQSKLANDNSYSRYGALGNTFSTGSTFVGTNNNPAFGLGSDSGTPATAWAKVDPSVATGGTYRYQVNNSNYAASGVLRLQSTGRVGNVTRTVVADLKQSGFLDFLYFTDYEIRDPALTSGCTAAYGWAVASRPNCTTIQFGPNDVISGPAHSNDTMNICGATFGSTVSSANPTAPFYATPAASCDNTGLVVSPKNIVQMPSTIGSLIQETRSDLTASTVPRPGCLYSGPTTINFTSDGKMTVYSPWTLATNIKGNPVTGGSVADGCGTPGYSSAGGTLGSPGGQTMPVVDSNLIYVQNVPQSAGSGDPNYWGTKTPKNYSCTGADGSTAGNGVGFPAKGEVAPSATSYGCTNGDAFVQGTVKGNVTVAANNYLYVTDDVLYADASKDMLGLIGENNVIVYNPIAATYTTSDTETYNCGTTRKPATCTRPVTTTHAGELLDRTASDRTIDAAIMSVLHSFTVQNYDADRNYPKGRLTVLGAIAQKFRGTVATTSGNTTVTGYAKNYQYDSRLAFQAPPKFLSPVSTTYGITQVTESKTAISATGANL